MLADQSLPLPNQAALLRFDAFSPVMLARFPDGPDTLWAADIAVSRGLDRIALHKQVLFVESHGLAFIYGIEREDGVPPRLRADLAAKQREFIEFLRRETQQMNAALGAFAALFVGHESVSEERATAAYVAARRQPLRVGVGFRNVAGVYELIAIVEEPGFAARPKSPAPAARKRRRLPVF